MSNEKKIVFCLDSDCYDVSTHASCGCTKINSKGLKNWTEQKITVISEYILLQCLFVRNAPDKWSAPGLMAGDKQLPTNKQIQ